MKKLLLAAALAIVAGQAQAVGVCAEKVQCDGSRREGETFKCAPCICPEVKCPIPAETICECAPATPIKKEVCKEREVRCHTCNKVRAHCGCKGGFRHPHHHHGRVEEVVYVTDEKTEEKSAPVQTTRTVKTPKRVMNRN